MAVVDYAAPLELIDLPQPEIKPGHVLVRVLMCGVCFSDFKTAKGKMPYSPTLELPHVPGHEISGEVVEASPESDWKVGDRVVVYHYWPCNRCAYCLRGLENLCIDLRGWVGFTHNGGFAEYLLVPSDRLLRVPEGISAEQAAPATCASGTAYRAVVTQGRAQAGETVLVLGVGGVGLQALQIAQVAGARAFAVDIDPRKLEAAQKFSPAGIALAGEEAEALVRDSTAGLGVDVIIDTVGHHESLEQSSTLVRRQGRIVAVGYLTGEFTRVLSNLLALNELEIIGSRYAQMYEMQRVLELFGAGKVQAVIDDVLPLESANEAFERLESGNVVGRTVLQVGEPSG
jgi:propanol-preferring alcohol dehydrogenase